MRESSLNNTGVILTSYPVLKLLFQTECSLCHEEGYLGIPSSRNKNYLYFLVHGEYRNWPILMEANTYDKKVYGL